MQEYLVWMCLRLPIFEIAKFGIVGVTAAFVHLFSLMFSVEILLIAPVTANVLAFSCAVSVTYAGQRFWVFADAGNDAAQVLKFLLTAVGGLAANTLIMALVDQGLQLNYLIGYVTALVTVPVATFMLNKFWVFGPAAPVRLVA